MADISATVRGTTYYIDVSVAQADTTDPTHIHARLHSNGVAAREREQKKYRDYQNHPNLIPFVLESGGRWGTKATAFIRTAAPEDPGERTAAITHIQHTVSALLQRGRADGIITAHGL